MGLENVIKIVMDRSIPFNVVSLFLSHLKKITKEEVFLRWPIQLSKKEEILLNGWLDRYKNGEPLSKIIGFKEFYSLHFLTNQHTLDPRPESELIIDAVLKYSLPSPRVLDLGTGTGCLIVTLLKIIPDATGCAVDVSQEALQICEHNSIHHGVNNRLTLIHSDWLSNIALQHFDVIVSNPPYIEKNEIIDVGASFDPPLALYGGIRVYEIIFESLGTYLTANGIVVFEVGYKQMKNVIAIAYSYGFKVVEVHEDLQGYQRCVVFSKIHC